MVLVAGYPKLKKVMWDAILDRINKGVWTVRSSCLKMRLPFCDINTIISATLPFSKGQQWPSQLHTITAKSFKSKSVQAQTIQLFLSRVSIRNLPETDGDGSGVTSASFVEYRPADGGEVLLVHSVPEDCEGVLGVVSPRQCEEAKAQDGRRCFHMECRRRTDRRREVRNNKGFTDVQGWALARWHISN